MLEGLVKRYFPGFRNYYSVMRNVVLTSAVCLFAGTTLHDKYIAKPRADSAIVAAEQKGIEIRTTSDGTPFQKPTNVEIFDEQKKEFNAVYSPYRNWDLYLHFAWLWGLSVIVRNHKRRLPVELSNAESAFRSAGQVLGTAGLVYYGLPTLAVMKTLPLIEAGSLTLAMPWIWMGRTIDKYFLEKRYKAAKNKQDIKSKEYSMGEYLHLNQAISHSIKAGKLDQVLEYLLRQFRLVQRFSPKERECLEDEHSDMFVGHKYLLSRALSRVKPSYERDLKVIIMDTVGLHPMLERDVETAVIRNPHKEIELRVLDYALSRGEKKREKGRGLYTRLSELGQIERLGGRNNVVVAMNCGSLGRQYVVKRNLWQKIEREAEQTTAIQRGIDDPQVLVPDVGDIYYGADFRELENDAIIFLSYENGKEMQLRLRELGRADQIKLLLKAIKANAKTAHLGISTYEEHRRDKAMRDILENDNLDSNMKGIFLDNIDVCFRFADGFPSVYDRDGHTENLLVTRDGRIVLLDLEARAKSDPIYSPIKLIEHNTVLGFDDDGIAARERLCIEHASSLALSPEESQPHYFSSILLKALSFHKFSGGIPMTLTRSYYASARFGLDVAASRFERFYGQQQRRQLATLSRTVSALMN